MNFIILILILIISLLCGRHFVLGGWDTELELINPDQNIVGVKEKSPFHGVDTFAYKYIDTDLDKTRADFHFNFVQGFTDDIDNEKLATIRLKGEFEKNGILSEEKLNEYKKYTAYLYDNGSRNIVKTNNSFHYAIDQVKEKLEHITHTPIEKIHIMTKFFGLQTVVKSLFDPVDKPSINDVVYYPGTHVNHLWGVYEGNGKVRSYWRGSHKNIFKHYIFLIPQEFGNKALFFRIKDTADIINKLTNIENSEPMYDIDNNKMFVFMSTPDRQQLRNKLRSATNIERATEFPGVRILLEDHEGVCYNYAFSTFFDTCLKQLDCLEDPQRIKIFLEKYFERTDKPEVNDLVVYFDKKPDETFKILHYAIYIGNNLVKSKWGDSPVFIHPIFITLPIYNNYAVFYKLKDGITKNEALKGLFSC